MVDGGHPRTAPRSEWGDCHKLSESRAIVHGVLEGSRKFFDCFSLTPHPSPATPHAHQERGMADTRMQTSLYFTIKDLWRTICIVHASVPLSRQAFGEEGEGGAVAPGEGRRRAKKS